MTRNIALQLLSEQACVLFFSPPPSFFSLSHAHTHTLRHTFRCFSLSYIRANTNMQTHTHIHLLPDYCSPSRKRCGLLCHSPPLAESKSFSQHSLMAHGGFGRGAARARQAVDGLSAEHALQNTPISLLFVFDCNQDNVLTWHGRWN